MIINQLKRIIGYPIVKVYKPLTLMGIYVKNHEDDRQILEKTIFPYFRTDDQFNKIVFIGVNWYTKQYNRIFKAKTYRTIDINPKMKKYGSKGHIVDSMCNLRKYFEENEVDLIFCNGVFGWGLNSTDDIEESFKVCYDILREGGVFILGWNDIEKYRPIPVSNIKALKLFKQFCFEPLGTDTFLTKNPNRHTFNFYIKSGSGTLRS